MEDREPGVASALEEGAEGRTRGGGGVRQGGGEREVLYVPRERLDGADRGGLQSLQVEEGEGAVVGLVVAPHRWPQGEGVAEEGAGGGRGAVEGGRRGQVGGDGGRGQVCGVLGGGAEPPRAEGEGRWVPALVRIVDEVAARAVAAEPGRVEGPAELGLVLGVPGHVAELPGAVGELALLPVLAEPGLGEGPAQLRLVPGAGGDRGARARLLLLGRPGCGLHRLGVAPVQRPVQVQVPLGRRAGGRPPQVSPADLERTAVVVVTGSAGRAATRHTHRGGVPFAERQVAAHHLGVHVVILSELPSASEQTL